VTYLHSTEGPPIEAEQVRALGSLLGLQIPPEDLEPLSLAFRDLLASFAQLDNLDLTGLEPRVAFDPRW